MKKLQTRKLYIYIIIILIVLTIAVLYSFRAYHNYSVWKSQKNYFNYPNPKIQPWMTIDMISKEFNIPHAEIIKELNITEPINLNINLARFCRQYKRNCTILVDRLNNLVER